MASAWTGTGGLGSIPRTFAGAVLNSIPGSFGSGTARNIADPNVDIYGTPNKYQGPSTPQFTTNDFDTRIIGSYGTGNTLSDTDNRTGTGGSSPAPTLSPQQLAQFDQSIGIVNSALGRLPQQLDVARGNINDQFRVGQNELNSSRNQAQNSYRTSSTQNQQSYRGDKNVIADQASQGLRGLLRMLGAFGAGGSSEAQFNAPEAVAQQATIQRSGAGQTFSENQQGLDTNWGNFQTQEENERRKLGDWKTQQLNSAEAQNTQNKIDLISQLAQLTNQRTAGLGGDLIAASQPYVNEVNQLSERVNSLGRFSPQYQGNTPVYQARPLDSYDASQSQATPQTNALQSTTSPYLAALLGAGQEERRRIGF